MANLILPDSLPEDSSQPDPQTAVQSADMTTSKPSSGLILPDNLDNYNPESAPVSSKMEATESQQPTSLNDVISGANYSGMPLTDRLKSGVQKLVKIAQATYTGFDAIGTTIAKGGSYAIHEAMPESLSKYVNTPEQIQKSYDSTVRTYEKNAKEDPTLRLFNFAGSMAAASIVPGGLAKGAATAGRAIAGGIGSVAGGILGGAAQGAAIGGLMTQEGQGEDIFNKQGAIGGAIAGGVLGPLESAIGRSVDKVPGFNKAYSDVNSSINGKQLNFKGSGISYTPNYDRSLVDKGLQYLPGIFGTARAYNKDSQALRPYITDMVNAVSNNTVNASKTIIGNELNRSASKAKDLYNQVWTALPKVYDESGIKSIPIKNTVTALNSNLREFGVKGEDNLYHRTVGLLKQDEFPFEQALKLKQDLWTEYQFLSRKVAMGTATSAERDTANKALLPAFWSIADDIGTAAKGTKAEEAFNYANSVSKGYHETFDPQYHPLLVNAIEDINKSRRGVNDFVKALINPKSNLGEKDSNMYIGLLGSEGRKELENVGLRSMASNAGIPELVDNSMNVANKSLDIGKFLTSVQASTREGAPSKAIYQDSLKALKGLNFIGNNFLQATKGIPDQAKQAGISAPGKFALMGGLTGAGAYAAMGHPIAAAGILGTVGLTTAAMSKFAASQPLKRSLSWLTTALETDGVQPAMAQKLYEITTNNMLKAGLIYNMQPDGSVLIDNKANK